MLLLFVVVSVLAVLSSAIFENFKPFSTFILGTLHIRKTSNVLQPFWRTRFKISRFFPNLFISALTTATPSIILFFLNPFRCYVHRHVVFVDLVVFVDPCAFVSLLTLTSLDTSIESSITFLGPLPCSS